MGRWLVLGGTRFLSAAVAEAALGRGHEVVCAARGASGPVPEGATLVPVDRDEPEALDPLRGERFDAVVDVATMSLPWVHDALDALGATAGHWTFVSSISVYADPGPVGQGVDAPLLPPREAAHGRSAADDPDAYGAIKVASENAVRDAVGDRAFVVRAGLICGSGDRSDRFGYWPQRFARGGRAVVPDDPGQPAQIVDVRDLADWIVRAGEDGLTGTFDGSGPRTTLGALLDEVAAAVGAPDLERVPVTPETLTAAGVTPWSGPRSLPLWLPPTHRGMTAHDTSAAAAAGLRCRPIAETARDSLAHEHALGPDRPRVAGLTPEDEELLLS
ncbi:NAD-dependent epimerase/dehydratase family protein [Pseudonocardia sp.]|uniref:NAD-dependent epimerase/dehydratase family protein n=1 Tax=Pseudonocardia sp. TaxID=60912 RepID=UPI0026107735|nr:NAD-dependent epimerase/dehydratase family protein [Pseudonocardia sp.]MCW2718788.1 NAD-dependent epimerase/dehydratase [Pseudonocardia sp.]